MLYEKEEQARLIRQSSKHAIALAMEGRWREAVEANKGIIESFPNDVEAYNRLGRAYIELGEYSLAREAYGRAGELDPHNTIAQKNLRRLSHLGEAVGVKDDSFHRVELQHFIEETGKAGVVRLYHLAPKEILAKMVAGDRVYLKIDGSNLVVESGRGEYLGQVEPKHGQRLIRLMTGGNIYTATVISSSEDAMAVIIREVFQHPSQAGQLSFVLKGFDNLRPYVSDKILRRQIDYDAAAVREPSYIATGEDESELLSEEATENNEEETE